MDYVMLDIRVVGVHSYARVCWPRSGGLGPPHPSLLT